MSDAKIGIIGGTGLDEIEDITKKRKIQFETPFGPPSAEIIIGEINHTNVAFLPRHGKGHSILPSEINYRANIFAFKKIGVEFLLSISAVGSLREDIKPLDIVLPDQFIDRTKSRVATFFGNGIVAHVNFADPTCEQLREIVHKSARNSDFKIVNGSTYVCIEGPQFSTRAESYMYRQLGFDIIGMTNLPEAKLAREAEMCYCTLALVTDYDCWHSNHSEIDIEMVFKNLTINLGNAKKLIKETILNMPDIRKCNCSESLENSIITKTECIPEKIKNDLKPIIGRFF
jgi:5'-methylthioadenosine phosphorylase